MKEKTYFEILEEMEKITNLKRELISAKNV